MTVLYIASKTTHAPKWRELRAQVLLHGIAPSVFA
jgi:hypothetical protein